MKTKQYYNYSVISYHNQNTSKENNAEYVSWNKIRETDYKCQKQILVSFYM